MDINKGDIFWVEGGRVAGAETAGARPAIIVSNNKANQFAPVVTVVWLRSQECKPLPTHCMVRAMKMSTAVCENVTTVSKDRVGAYIRTATEDEVREVDACLRIHLDLVERRTKEEILDRQHPENIDEMVAILGTEAVIGYLKCKVYQADGEKKDYYMRKLNELKGVCHVRTVHEGFKR